MVPHQVQYVQNPAQPGQQIIIMTPLPTTSQGAQAAAAPPQQGSCAFLHTRLRVTSLCGQLVRLLVFIDT